MIEKLPQATTVIWDFDGVFYNFEDVPNRGYQELCNHCNAIAACKIIPDLDFEDAVLIAKESYRKYKDSVSAFVPYAQEHGIGEQFLKEAIFHEYHRILHKETMAKHSHLLAEDKMRTEKFEKLQNSLKHCILSHSSADDFLHPSLSNMNLSKYFDRCDVWGFKEFDFESKSRNANGIAKILKSLGITNQAEVIFVDDTLQNLQIAQQAFPEIITVLKTNEDIKLEGIDFVVASQVEFLDILIREIT